MKKPSTSKQSPAKSASIANRRAALSKFARGLIREWRRLDLCNTGESIVVAVSGGADSVALLLALNELVGGHKLKVEILVAHLNHKLRGATGDADARWVQSLAKRLGRESVIGSADVKQVARTSNDNLEQAARRARYEFLAHVAKSHKATLIVTGHTMNDQAETVLLNFIRGSGSDGLRGIEPLRPLFVGGAILLGRPLMSWATRRDTETYCRQNSIEHREDAMNVDEAFARVRVRKELIPLLEAFNPKFIQSTARTAEILRQENVVLDDAAARLLALSSAVPQANGESNPLRADLLREAEPALRRRALRLWLARNRGNLRRIEYSHIIAIEKLLSSAKSGQAIELPGGAVALRRGGRLYFRKGKVT